ncbi:LPXTG-motif cell wall-anchored protein [Haloactinopolyspora alba]|uniref:LPXTG-motif cell wall-anchored protein n=1 Tax=Haloactinopolyspora alba TaxID=648780 RepID=A0A2P8EBH6_9ACTN|nr:SpaA isopeptide-forming pilin-related protein [Haloactinopolyspora alba]PSL06825.1 LPXTG-motif cell wall-anchored protein [Haloactinopolyspora alba]
MSNSNAYRWHAGIAAATVLVFAGTGVGVPAQANTDGNSVIGGFEIDGNFYEGFDNSSTATGPDGDPVDWGSAEISTDVSHLVDPTGNADDTVYGQGSKEDDLSSWQNEGSQSAPGQADIGNIYVYDRVVGGDLYAFVAFDRAQTTGTTTWYLELNQHPNTTNQHGVSVPDRTVNDLRLTMTVQGNGDFAVETAHVWDGSDWVVAPGGSGDAWAGLANDSEITTTEGAREEARFMELGFNLTELLGADDACVFTGYQALNLRSQSGQGTNAELKDHAVGTVDVPSRCGDLVIEKRDVDGNLVGGATFGVTPNPIPEADDPGELTIVDNDENDVDPADGVVRIDPAEPGEYTVTEASPPPGYIGTDEAQEVTLDEFGSATVVFENRLGTLAWQKLDESSGEPVCCATFTVEATEGDGADAGVSVTVVDNGENDADTAAGVVLVEELMTGTYTITETVAPEGYELPVDPVRTDVVISAETPDVVVSEPFEDPRQLAELTVRKIAEDSEEPLAGAVFELYLDDGNGAPDAPEGDTLVGECTTGADGTCTRDGLDFGDYYWFEVQAPDGYLLPETRFSEMISVTATNTGTSPATVTFVDPPAEPEPTPTPTEPEPTPTEPEPTPTEPTPSPTEPEPTEPEPSPTDPGLPDTGGSSVAGWLAISLALLMTGAVVLARRPNQC